ncbi:MAG TPA: hypothetical protein VFF20_08455 [Pseudogracilibacillus sp.]|nr:hypothetical protein [Pseudogracilibacillus sp.]
MVKRYMAVTICMFVLLLSGCLYPQSELAKNQMPNEEQLALIESAVIQYKEQTNGLVPIKTNSNDVALYEKYVVDFTTLREAQLINEIPATAYENGGFYQYVIITPEDDPRIKLIDLRVTEKIREVYVKLDIYRQKNLYPPFGKQVADGIYEINYEKLGFKEEPVVISPFSRQELPLLITTDGDVIVDYRFDIQMTIDEHDLDVAEDEDLRYILEENYPFVPAYSVAYVLENKEPVFKP